CLLARLWGGHQKERENQRQSRPHARLSGTRLPLDLAFGLPLEPPRTPTQPSILRCATPRLFVPGICDIRRGKSATLASFQLPQARCTFGARLPASQGVSSSTPATRPHRALRRDDDLLQHVLSLSKATRV